jgi:5-methyltetrahydropteroyltriglutamate--homocysteine methyltransferase
MADMQQTPPGRVSSRNVDADRRHQEAEPRIRNNGNMAETATRQANKNSHAAGAIQALRVDQIGSLGMPGSLKKLYERNASGEISGAELKAAQDDAIRAVIRKQEAIGLPIITDGEYRRRNFQDSFAEAVTGYDVPQSPGAKNEWREPNRPMSRTEQNFESAGPAVVTRRGAIARLALKHNVILDEYRFAAGVASAPAKVSLIGPDRISQRFAWEKSQAVYQGLDDFISDVVKIQRQMISELVAAGCRYVHIDAPGFTAYVDKLSLERMKARGEDPQKNLERAIEAENAVIAGFDDVVFGLHICRGNPRGIDASGKLMPQWHREGHYDPIAEQLFTSLKHDRLLLEYDSERAGSFEPLRFVGKDKVVVLGLVTTKHADLEPLDGLKQKIDQASRYVPVERLAISPQCGFSSDHAMHTLPEDVQWAKFERLLELADQVWG